MVAHLNYTDTAVLTIDLSNKSISPIKIATVQISSATRDLLLIQQNKFH